MQFAPKLIWKTSWLTKRKNYRLKKQNSWKQKRICKSRTSSLLIWRLSTRKPCRSMHPPRLKSKGWARSRQSPDRQTSCSPNLMISSRRTNLSSLNSRWAKVTQSRCRKKNWHWGFWMLLPERELFLSDYRVRKRSRCLLWESKDRDRSDPRFKLMIKLLIPSRSFCTLVPLPQVCSSHFLDSLSSGWLFVSAAFWTKTLFWPFCFSSQKLGCWAHQLILAPYQLGSGPRDSAQLSKRLEKART